MLIRWLKLFVGLVRRYFWGVPKITPPVKCVHILGENKMGLVYVAYMPPVEDADLVKRELGVTVDGVTTVMDVELGVESVELDPVADNALVSLVLRGVDDAGNVGDWSDPYEFTAVDTIFPVKPGMVSVKLDREIADPVVVPPVDEEPVDEEPVDETPEEEVPVDETPEGETPVVE